MLNSYIFFSVSLPAGDNVPVQALCFPKANENVILIGYLSNKIHKTFKQLKAEKSRCT
jgi:hypothetical protein